MLTINITPVVSTDYQTKLLITRWIIIEKMLYASLLLDVRQHVEETDFAQLNTVMLTVMPRAIPPLGVQHPTLRAIPRDTRLTPAEIAAHRRLSLIGILHHQHSPRTNS